MKTFVCNYTAALGDFLSYMRYKRRKGKEVDLYSAYRQYLDH